MKIVKYSAILAALTALLVIPSAQAQLYPNTDKDLTTGDLNNQDYWWSKFDAMMLDLAIKQRQPEGPISVNVAIALRRLDDLAKKFPKHQEIAKWKAHFTEVEGKISPNADRRVGFTPECPWDESNFGQLWVNLHWAKVAYDAKDYTTALSDMQNVMQNYDIMLRPDRMKNYPDELRKWVVDSKPDADKLYKAVKEKTGRA